MIQIDMPMPKNCLDCPACNEYLMCAIPVNGRKWGENDVREFGQGRPEWCPMKEQEAVSITTDYFDGFGNRTSHCPSCNSRLVWHQNKNYCGECGQAVKWE